MPPNPLHPPRSAHRRGWTAAVLVGVLGAGALAAVQGSSTQPADAGDQRAVVRPAAVPDGSGAEGEWKRVEFRGVAISVPADWPVYDLAEEPTRCVRWDEHAVFLAAEVDLDVEAADCPADAIGKTETVQLRPHEPDAFPEGGSPTSTTVVNGHRAVVDVFSEGDGELEVLIPELDMIVQVTSGDGDDLARRILGTVEAVSG